MYTKIFLTLLVSALLTLNATADGKEDKTEINTEKSAELYLTGTVTDKLTGEALVGVEIKLKGTDKKVYTDFDGKFAFGEIKPGIYDISAQYISYEKNELKNQSIDVLNTSFKLEMSPVN